MPSPSARLPLGPGPSCPLGPECACGEVPAPNGRALWPAGSEYDEEEVDYEESDSDESWTTESAISSEAILSSMCMNGGEEKPFACPVPGCKKRYKVRAHLTWLDPCQTAAPSAWWRARTVPTGTRACPLGFAGFSTPLIYGVEGQELFLAGGPCL